MICKNTKPVLSFRRVLLTVQMISLFLSILLGPAPQPLSAIAYCLTVFSSPLLLIICGHRYLVSEKDWYWEIIPLIAEALFSILFVGSMIYGIWFMDGNVVLFTRLLSAYAVTTVICAQGYYAYCLKAKCKEKAL